MNSILSQCEIDALPAGKELDAIVARLMGQPFCKPSHGGCCTCQTCGHHHDDCQCGYSEDEAQAIEAATKFCNQHGWRVIGPSGGEHNFFISRSGDSGELWYCEFPNPWEYGEGDTLPLAICRALAKCAATLGVS